ncbi:PB1 domain-containing protein [Tanacetum coccineum]|uniref:PB1 domain-containing protein n=1 Tax=Tanacetum coccineum TaxID=301880 RepID=A0ABQ5BNI3_9ASTR
MLKEKIRCLFSLDSNVDFTMTYVDEDGDVVLLADDDDLRDIEQQTSLNHLRITIKLNKKGNPIGSIETSATGVSELVEKMNSASSSPVKDSKVSENNEFGCLKLKKETEVQNVPHFQFKSVKAPTNVTKGVEESSIERKDTKGQVKSEFESMLHKGVVCEHPTTKISHHTPLEGLHDFVDASKKNLGETLVDVNLPDVGKNTEVVDQDHLMNNALPGSNLVTVSDSESSTVDLPPKDKGKNIVVDDSVFDNGDVSSSMATFSASTEPAELESTWNPFPGPVVSLASCPTISGATSTASEVGESSGSGSPYGIAEQEEALVRKLEDMGFKQLDFNKQILRMNDYDLEKTLNDLCGVSDWEPMLDDLQEWGTFAETKQELFEEGVWST